MLLSFHCKSLRYIIVSLTFLCNTYAHAQLVGDMDDESRLFAESKQVNQFFRRFNGEENEKGDRYYPSDKQYRSQKLRKKFLGVLFDNGNTGMSANAKRDFAEQVLNSNGVLDFHSNNWFAEVRTIFQVNGTSQPVTLYMELEKNHLGYKWVIRKAHADFLEPYFVRDTSKVGRFLHPMSHELNFMNLRKAFANKDSLSQFMVKDFSPDHLSVLLHEMQAKTITFNYVESVRFHFFQIAGWYFELANFNRPGYNTGWLISNLVKLKDDTDKDILKRYIYNESK